MAEKKSYYLGTGTEFNKAQCREYKTLDGALKAASKDESLVVWDENGNVIGSLTDNVPEGALETNPDGSINAYNEKGEKVGTVDAAQVAEATGEKKAAGDAEDGEKATKEVEVEDSTKEQKKGENEANAEQEREDDEDDEHPTAGITREQTGKFHITVVCSGSLRLRRSASWDNSNECGRASKGQTYIGKRLFMLGGLPMIETVDGLFISAAAEHVKIEKIG